MFSRALKLSRRLFLVQRNVVRQNVWPRIATVVAVGGTALWVYNHNKAPVKTDVGYMPFTEVLKHNTIGDCWVVLDGDVYDVSGFLDAHPGGASRIMRFAGRDATRAFKKFHTKLVLKNSLLEITYLGPVIGQPEKTEEILEEKPAVVTDKPPIEAIFSLADFKAVAEKVLPAATFAYHSGGASDEVTVVENGKIFSRVFFRPKVLQDVCARTSSSEMLGCECDLPLYISGFAGSPLAHELAEHNLQKAAYAENIVQMIPRQISVDIDEFLAGVPKDQKQWSQWHFYSQKDYDNVLQHIKRMEDLGTVKALFFNVDLADLGARERDSRVRMAEDAEEELNVYADNKGAKYFSGLTWDSVKDIMSKTKLPVGLKGVQRGEDVVKAAQLGVKAVVLSNHGGRQLDYSRAPLEVLVELKEMLRKHGLDGQIEIYIDGGINRGSDIVKALCLGASGVGIGRPMLYAMAGYGEDGVKKAIQILKKETLNNMALLGANSVKDLDESLVDTSMLKQRYTGA